MKTPCRSTAVSRREPFNARIDSYAKLGAAVLVTAAAAVGTASAGAQAVTTLTPSSFGGSLPFGTAETPAVFTINGETFTLAVQSNGSGSHYGGAGILGSVLVQNPALGHGLAKSATIGVAPFNSFANQLAVATTTNGGGAGLILPHGPNGTATGYIGFKVAKGADNYYGWLRVKVANGANFLSSISLLGDENGVAGAFALNSIRAGQTTAAAVPEPAQVATGLGLFALGAAGVREYRRRRALAAARPT